MSGEYLFFLDDDAWLPDAGHARRAARGASRADPALGLVQPRVVDPTGTTSPRALDPADAQGRSGAVRATSSRSGRAPSRCRAASSSATGGWPAEFFYAHEGIELAWRVWDTGHTRAVRRRPGRCTIRRSTRRRHAYYYRLNARNRVWLARRNLPVLLEPVYVGTWTAVQVARTWRDRDAMRAWFGGFREGWREDPGPRRPISWRTVARMTRRGRPPIV